MKIFLFRRLPLALGALSCALVLASCFSRPADENAASTENAVSDNAATPANDDNSTTNSVVEFAALETIYVPGKDDLLHEQKVSRKSIDSQLKSGDPAAPGLQEIIEKAPQYFPKGAKVNSTTVTDKGITVDLSSNFVNDEFWRNKGEKMTELAVYALVNSAAATTGAQGANDSKSVTFTVDKKPAKTLGEFDIDGEIESETRLIAPK